MTETEFDVTPSAVSDVRSIAASVAGEAHGAGAAVCLGSGRTTDVRRPLKSLADARAYEAAIEYYKAPRVARAGQSTASANQYELLVDPQISYAPAAAATTAANFSAAVAAITPNTSLNEQIAVIFKSQ